METCKAIMSFWDSCVTTIMDILQFGVPAYVLFLAIILVICIKVLYKRFQQRKKS